MGARPTSLNLPSVLSVTTHSAKRTETTEGKSVRNETSVEALVDGCLERIGEDDPDEEQIFRDLWEDETQREVMIEILKADCEVRRGRPPGFLGG